MEAIVSAVLFMWPTVVDASAVGDFAAPIFGAVCGVVCGAARDAGSSSVNVTTPVVTYASPAGCALATLAGVALLDGTGSFHVTGATLDAAGCAMSIRR